MLPLLFKVLLYLSADTLLYHNLLYVSTQDVVMTLLYMELTINQNLWYYLLHLSPKYLLAFSWGQIILYPSK